MSMKTDPAFQAYSIMRDALYDADIAYFEKAPKGYESEALDAFVDHLVTVANALDVPPTELVRMILDASECEAQTQADEAIEKAAKSARNQGPHNIH